MFTSSSNRTPTRLLALGVLICTLVHVRYSEAVTPRRLVEVADLGNLVMSPDGRSVAFRLEQAALERNALDTAWYVQDIDGMSPPRRIADGGFAIQAFYGLPSPAPAVWSPDGRWIYYRAMLDGKIDVWRAAADGSSAEPVTLGPADVRDFELSADGKILKYNVGATREQVDDAERTEYGHGVRLDKTVPVGRPLFHSSYIEGKLETTRYFHGIELASVPLLADVADHWKAIDLVTGEHRNLPPLEVPSQPTSLAKLLNLAKSRSEPWQQASDQRNQRIAMLTRTGDGNGLYQKPYLELRVASADGQQPVVCRADRCTNKEIANVVWRPDSDEVLFTVVDPDQGYAQSIVDWNAKTGEVRPIAQSRGLLNGGRDEHSSCGVSAQFLVCVAAEADRPPRLERIELATGQRHILFDPNAALALDMAVTPARLLRWTDAKGHPFTGQFFAARRSDGRAPPLFVNYYHCSGFIRGGVGDEWPMASLAEQGIAALCINHAALQLDAIKRYDQGLAAVRGAVESLAAEGMIDRTRVGMGGLSFGTEVTLWTVANSDLLAAASITSPLQSPLGYALRSMHEDSFLPALRKYWQLGSTEETPQQWRRLSPAFNLNHIRCPILMQMPEQEYLLSLDYTVPLVKDQRATLYVFPDETHFKFQPQHKLVAYQRNLDWFKFWLQGSKDSDFAKREQYEAWSKLKARGADARLEPGSSH